MPRASSVAKVAAGIAAAFHSSKACNHGGIEPFETTLALDLFLLRRLRRELAAWLARVEVPDDIGVEVILATHEAAANAIEHARLGTEITVRGARADTKVLIVVANHGRWGKTRSVDEMRGRGLILMEQLMSDVEIQAKSQRTVIRMRKDLPARADASPYSKSENEPLRRPVS